MLADLHLVDDPWFYAVAIPAVLLVGMAKSGFASGFGALATPLLALMVPVPQAAAIMLPLLLVMDAMGVQQLWRQRDPALLRALLPAGLAGTLLGAALFGVLSAATVSGVVGALTLAFLAQRLWVVRRSPPATPSGAPASAPASASASASASARATPPASPPASPSASPPASAAPRSRMLGLVCGLASGLTSFVAHAGAPPLTAYLLPLRLAPATFSGTLAVYFGALNLFKLLPYAALGLIDSRNLATSVVLLPFTPLGVWAGLRLTHRVSPDSFYRLAYAGMLLTGCKLLWDGLR